jgi:hypothetical protein
MDGSVVMAVDKAPTSADQKGRDQVYQLAWQGGGAHGAFAWDVFDRLIEDERIEIRQHQRDSIRLPESRRPSTDPAET